MRRTEWKFPKDANYAGSADRLGLTVIGLLILAWAGIVWVAR